jgi:hypothetical protein
MGIPMRPIRPLSFALALSLCALAAHAQGNSNKNKGDKGNNGDVISIQPVPSGNRNCPPGLAKKNVPCVPPGQAKTYRIGDILPRDFVRIQNPGNWTRRGNGSFVRLGDYVYEIDNDTRKVLNLVGAAADLLN